MILDVDNNDEYEIIKLEGEISADIKYIKYIMRSGENYAMVHIETLELLEKQIQEIHDKYPEYFI
jgi:hypothetical protein